MPILDDPERVRLYLHYGIRLSRAKEGSNLCASLCKQMAILFKPMTRRDRDWALGEMHDFEEAGQPKDWSLSTTGAPSICENGLMLTA